MHEALYVLMFFIKMNECVRSINVEEKFPTLAISV